MPPATTLFPPSELPQRVQAIQKNGKERRRKDPVDLKQCELMQMWQYDCKPNEETKVVVCWPYTRLFRKCANGLSVETTAWEGDKEAHEAMATAHRSG